MPENFDPNKKTEVGYHDKKLSAEELSLLEQQGLIADIRNKFGSITGFLDLYEVAIEENADGDDRARNMMKRMLPDAAKKSKESVRHILAAMEYIMQEQDPEKLKKLIEGHHGKE